MTHSMRYSCAIESRHLMTCSNTLGKMELWKREESTDSSCERRTKLVPTRMRSSMRSFSLLSFSLVCPWCCMRTHSLFISPKFCRMKSMESATSPSRSSVLHRTHTAWWTMKMSEGGGEGEEKMSEGEGVEEKVKGLKRKREGMG